MTKEFEELKEALKKPASPEAMARAAETMKRYLVAHPAKKSKPMLVSLGYKKTYPSAVPVDKIPDELERNSEFFDLMGRIVKEK